MPGEGTGDEERPVEHVELRRRLGGGGRRRCPTRPPSPTATRTLTWGELDRRADNLARWLLGAGVGHQDKVAIYLYNCPEYLEATFACFKLGLVPINTNYRYADDELVYLWENADTVAVVFHGAFVERIEGIRDRLPGIRSWLWVDDGTAPCPAWAVPYEEAAATTGAVATDGRPRVRRPVGPRAPTTSTCSTPAGPPACPRASCGARTTSSPGSTAPASAATPRTAGLDDVRAELGPQRAGHDPAAGLPADARHRRVHRARVPQRGRAGGHPRPPGSSTRSSCSTPSSASRSTAWSSWATPSPSPSWPRWTPIPAAGT